MNPHSCFTGSATRKDPNCDDDRLFRVKQRLIGLIFVDKSVTTIDTSTPALFKSTILAAEKAGTAKIIRRTSGSKAAPANTEGVPRGEQVRRIVNKAHSLTFIDFDYVQNEDFWNEFTPDEVANQYDLYYLTPGLAWPVIDRDLSIDVSDEFGDDINAEIVGTGSISWNQFGNPVSFAVNTTDFAERQDLFDISAMNFTATGATVSNNNITGDSGTPMEASLDTNVVGGLHSVEVIKGSLPTGIVATIDDVTDVLLITGTTVQVGTFPVTIKASNAYGVYTLIPVTLIITA